MVAATGRTLNSSSAGSSASSGASMSMSSAYGDGGGGGDTKRVCLVTVWAKTAEHRESLIAQIEAAKERLLITGELL